MVDSFERLSSFAKRNEKKARKTVTLETQILVIRKMEAGEKCANVYSSLGLAPVIVSTVMANAEKIKQLAQKTTKFRASDVSYTRNVNIEKMEQLLTPWVDDLNQNGIPLTRRAIAAKARSLLIKINKRWKQDIPC